MHYYLVINADNLFLWHKISDCLPPVGKTVIVLTSNNKIAVSLMYIPKDSKGNIISEKPEWKGSSSFTDSIIAWMDVPVLS